MANWLLAAKKNFLEARYPSDSSCPSRSGRIEADRRGLFTERFAESDDDIIQTVRIHVAFMVNDVVTLGAGAAYRFLRDLVEPNPLGVVFWHRVQFQRVFSNFCPVKLRFSPKLFPIT